MHRRLRLLFCALYGLPSLPLKPAVKQLGDHMRRFHRHQSATRASMTTLRGALAEIAGLVVDPLQLEPRPNGSPVLPELPVHRQRGLTRQRFHYLGRAWVVQDMGTGANAEAETGIAATVRRLTAGRLRRDDVRRILLQLTAPFRHMVLCQPVISTAELTSSVAAVRRTWPPH